MTPSELDAIATKRFGLRRKCKGLADLCKVDNATAWRWLNGKVPIPGLVDELFESHSRIEVERARADALQAEQAKTKRKLARLLK